MQEQHTYNITINWTGNNGTGTSGYTEYERSHVLYANGKPDLKCSSDTPFRGDNTKFNPEDFLVASLCSCHMLWYLHLCADAGVIVKEYIDNARGTMLTPMGKPGHFSEVVLYPVVKVAEESMIKRAIELHDQAHDKCFIANSMNFPVRHEPKCYV